MHLLLDCSWNGQDNGNSCHTLLKPCPYCTIKPVSPVPGTGSTSPHYARFYLTQFHLVPPETFRGEGFKQLRFIEHTCGFIADVRYLEFSCHQLSFSLLSIFPLCNNIAERKRQNNRAHQKIEFPHSIHGRGKPINLPSQLASPRR